MRADRDHRHRAGRARSRRARRRRSSPERARPGCRERREQRGAAARAASIRSGAHSRVADVEQPGGGGVGELGAALRRSASTPSRSGTSSSVRAAVELRRARAGGQLVDRVERQVLQAGDARTARPRARPACTAATAVGAARRGSAPGCRAARRRRRAGRSRPPRCRCRRRPAGRRPRPAARSPSRTPVYSREDVPVQRAGRCAPAGWGTGATSCRSSRSGADPADHDPAAGGAQVDRRDGARRRSSPWPPSAQERGGDAGVDRHVQARWCGSGRRR